MQLISTLRRQRCEAGAALGGRSIGVLDDSWLDRDPADAAAGRPVRGRAVRCERGRLGGRARKAPAGQP
eukprot:COSAG06_NODE_378_length_16640_cov_13.584729_1_plen_68_part_10